jgi:hypothetical protein
MQDNQGVLLFWQIDKFYKKENDVKNNFAFVSSLNFTSSVSLYAL